MIQIGNLDRRRHPAVQDETRLVASVDVEWTKNYRVPNGNRAFCYSVVWLAIPGHQDRPVDLAKVGFEYVSVYVDHGDECRDLVLEADSNLCTILNEADVLVGHQLCADLGVLALNAVPPDIDPTPPTRDIWVPSGIAAARDAWRARGPHRTPQVIDTRYDLGHLLTGRSRRLVDVCTELDLDVTQPELGSRSMTALHHRWLDDRDHEARERITVLNLRHSLSAALLTLRALGAGTWTGQLNVNQLLARQLDGTLAWLDQPTFRALLP